MQEAIPYRAHIQRTAAAGNTSPLHGRAVVRAANDVGKMVLENAVVVFGRRGCCMCHVLKTLLLGHGVNPVVFEVDETEEATVIGELSRVKGRKGQSNGGLIHFPAVFVGGKLFGGLDQVMATHISGELVPVLKDAGALWL